VWIVYSVVGIANAKTSHKNRMIENKTSIKNKP
jgi:hypothetical protein